MEHKPGQGRLRLARSSLLGDGLLERARSTTLGLLGLTAAVGLGIVALALNQGWPLVAGLPIPALPGAGKSGGEVSRVSPRVAPARPARTGHRARPLAPAPHPDGNAGETVAATPSQPAQSELAVAVPTQGTNGGDHPAAKQPNAESPGAESPAAQAAPAPQQTASPPPAPPPAPPASSAEPPVTARTPPPDPEEQEDPGWDDDEQGESGSHWSEDKHDSGPGWSGHGNGHGYGHWR